MRPDWQEYVSVVGGATVNILLWFWLLPVVPAAIVATITSTGLALAMAEWFEVLDKRRATIGDTSDT